MTVERGRRTDSPVDPESIIDSLQPNGLIEQASIEHAGYEYDMKWRETTCAYVTWVVNRSVT